MKHVQRTLAIKGDSKNGKEIISLLELLGGNNIHEYDGTDANVYYFINDVCNYIIDTYRNDSPKQLEDHLAFYTLDDFKARFPYKIGDKVDIIKGGTSCVCCEILNRQWNEEYNGIVYYVQDTNKKYWWVKADNIRYTRYSDLKIDLDDIVNENIEFDLSKYSYEVKDGKLIIEEKKHKYPKTYSECCERVNACCTVDISYNSDEDMLYNDEVDLTLLELRKLLICRNAYWKIAGEQMGLDKPWKPNWTTFEGMPAIFRFRYNIVCDSVKNQHCLLVFPTEKMRDAFYGNFKDLIESCKELL